MKHAASFFVAFFLAASAGAAPVYLKTGATGACDGTSWTDAYTNAAVAIRAAEAGDGLLYVARGVYVFTNTLAIASPLSIYGGFAGASMDETPATRDTAANQTVFSGDVGGDDYWVHVEPNEAAFGVTATSLTSAKVIGAAGVNLPPAFTGDYDTYRPARIGKNTAYALSINSAAVCTLDGLTFACFSADRDSNTSRTVAFASAGTIVNDCTFIANACQQGSLFSSAPTSASDPPSVRNCRFLFNWGVSSAQPGGGFYYSCANSVMTISNCQFVGVSRTTGARGNCLHVQSGGIRVKDCTFARCLMAPGSSFNKNYGGPANIFSEESSAFAAFHDCVVTNCYTASSADGGIPTMSPGNGSVKLERCHFAFNRQAVKAVEGKCSPMIGNVWSSSNRAMSFEGCTFASNVIVAASVAAQSGYALAIIGNYNVAGDARLLNCTFDGNRAEAVAAEGVTPVLCRGVATASYSTTANISCLANCAFYGPADGTYDIAQYGTSHNQPLFVVNTVFTAPGEARPNPIYADQPELVKLYSCSIQNRLSESGGFFFDGLGSDKVPLVRVATGVPAPRYALAAAARAPGIRDTRDVATNSVTETGISSWAFLLPDAATWQILGSTSTSSADFSQKLVGDATGAARPSGSFTRGPVQALPGTAEAGATLVLRRDPFDAGSFSDEAVQVVAAGAATEPVTVSVADPASYTFAGWYDENGDLYPSSATLSIPSLPAGTTVLTARIATLKRVTLTFSLDGHGTFTSTGTSTATIVTNALATFPEVPAFTLDDDWLFIGFTLPDTVPEEDTSYTARIVTKDVRVIRVVPAAEAPAVQDGLTWETAYTDLAAAYADAGLWHGEVWLKGGRYLLRDTIQLLPNVVVRGGFAGTETSADEADPGSNPSVLSGDINGDDYWCANNSTQNNNGRIWTGDTFNPPAMTASQWCWVPKGNAGDDTSGAFACLSGVITNSLFDGVTFTGFKIDTIKTGSAADAAICFMRCRFLGCGTSCDTTHMGAVNMLGTGSLAFTNCVFVGNWHAVNLEGTMHASVAGCAFTNNAGGYYGNTIFVTSAATTEIRGCEFVRNGGASHHYATGAALSFYNSTGSPRHVVEDCLFADNRITGQCHGCVTLNRGVANVTRCRFVGNVLRHTDVWGSTPFSASLCGIGGTLFARDCLFSGNSASDFSGNSDPYASVAAASGGTILLANCTIESNVVNGVSAKAGATVGLNGSGSIALVNCLIDGSSLSGEAVAEFYSPNASGNIGIVNTVVRNAAAGYTPFLLDDASFQPTIASSVISGYDPAALPDTGANGYLYNVVSATAAVGPLREGENGALARGVKGPVYATLGRPVWLVGTVLYIYDPVANAAKPWRNVASRSSYAASVSGLTLDTPFLPDAFGAARRGRFLSPGPLVGAPIPTVLTLK